jgi:hypothetical protein
MNDTLSLSTQTIQEIQSATSVVGLKDWLGLIALFSSALVAVLVGQYLQDRKAKKDRQYQNKFSIFASILGLRHARAGNENFVIAINQIPIVFHENKKVLEKLDRFIKTHVDPISPTEKVIENLNSDLNDLVLEIAKDLNYSNIDNNVMKSFYYPDWSFYRHQSDLIQNELYSIERFPDLLAAREKEKLKNKTATDK